MKIGKTGFAFWLQWGEYPWRLFYVAPSHGVVTYVYNPRDGKSGGFRNYTWHWRKPLSIHLCKV